MMLTGCDISDYQPNVDWARAKASGLAFAFIKATEGTTYKSPSFARNLAGAHVAGIVRGAYHFLSWTSDPKEQAANFLSSYTPRFGDLLPMLDCEACAVDSATAIAQVSGFLQAVEPHLGGARMLLYMSYSFPQDHLMGGSGFSGHPLFVAAYNDGDFDSNTPPAWRNGRVPFWQHTDSATVAGIPGSVDGDLFNGDMTLLQAMYTLRGL